MLRFPKPYAHFVDAYDTETSSASLSIESPVLGLTVCGLHIRTGEFSFRTCYRRIWRTTAKTNTRGTKARLASRYPRVPATRPVGFSKAKDHKLVLPCATASYGVERFAIRHIPKTISSKRITFYRNRLTYSPFSNRECAIKTHRNSLQESAY